MALLFEVQFLISWMSRQRTRFAGSEVHGVPTSGVKHVINAVRFDDLPSVEVTASRDYIGQGEGVDGREGGGAVDTHGR